MSGVWWYLAGVVVLPVVFGLVVGLVLVVVRVVRRGDG